MRVCLLNPTVRARIYELKKKKTEVLLLDVSAFNKLSPIM